MRLQNPHLFTQHRIIAALISLTLTNFCRAQTPEVERFEKEIRPILENHCYDCHGDGQAKGKVSFDKFASTQNLIDQTELWVRVLKNCRSGMMPPVKEERLSSEDSTKLTNWIKQSALKLDPQNPNPGRVTLRRLNRVEYRNTIRDLMGIDFRADEEFPADDTGYGFDTIGDVLTTSPLLLEKYIQAAETVVSRAVPLTSRVTPKREIYINEMVGWGDHEAWFSLYDPADVALKLTISKPGTYRVILNASMQGSFAFDPGRADMEWYVDGNRALQQQLKWEDGLKLKSQAEVKWAEGEHPLRLVIKPLLGKDKKPTERGNDGPPSANLKLQGITLIGPLEPEFQVPPAAYSRFFPRPEIPQDEVARSEYAAEILKRFSTLAFRRPVDDVTVKKLSSLAMETANTAGGSFERGIARAMSAVLASPRFLFRMEDILPENDITLHPQLDEYALASRLSYFLWSTMPDDELYELAARGELRKNLASQVKRLLKDKRAAALTENFVGQWLQTRDIESVSMDARIVLARDLGAEKEMEGNYDLKKWLNAEIDLAEKANDAAKVQSLRNELNALREKFGKRIEFSGSLRTAMRRELEMMFQHLLDIDGSALELLENDSTYLNEELAKHYGIPDVRGPEMRLVKLSANSLRGGLITMGTVLAVTSNPTRTSPVKRGVFILDNILGTPPPPPPPNIPSLEASEKHPGGHDRTLREALALHREQPLCSSCHNRMDPIGLALENFNAMGRWRERERGQQLEPPAGKLITDESFADVRELKHLLVTARRTDYYRCLTEKMFTYALGRGPEPCDISTTDAIVESLEKSQGKFSILITGIIESPAFQKRQRSTL